MLKATSGEKESSAERIRLLSGRSLDLFREHIEVARLMYAIYYGPPQGAPFFDFDAYHFKFQDAVRSLVEDGIRSGEFRKKNPVDMTWALIGAVNVAMESRLCHPEIGLDREGLARVLDVIFEGIAAEAGGPKEVAGGRRGRIGGAVTRSRNRARKEGRR
jgi:hypothetical protein